MIEVTQSTDNGYTVYNFTANNTVYDVLTDDNETYTVYSSRKGFAGRVPPKVYGSLAEMANRSKALANLAKLIEA